MVTNNYNILFTGMHNTSSGNRSMTVKCIDGTNYNPEPSTALYNAAYSLYLILGVNDTPPSKDDYTADRTGTTGLTLLADNNDYQTVVATTINSSNCNYFGTCLRTYRNDSNEDITIHEICSYGRVTASSASTKKYVMLSRDVIEPLTIHPGETYTFAVSIGEQNSSASAS